MGVGVKLVVVVVGSNLEPDLEVLTEEGVVMTVVKLVLVERAGRGEDEMLETFVLEKAEVVGGDVETEGGVLVGRGCDVPNETLEGVLGLWESQLGVAGELVFSGPGSAASRDREDFLDRSAVKELPVRVLAQFL